VAQATPTSTDDLKERLRASLDTLDEDSRALAQALLAAQESPVSGLTEAPAYQNPSAPLEVNKLLGLPEGELPSLVENALRVEAVPPANRPQAFEVSPAMDRSVQERYIRIQSKIQRGRLAEGERDLLELVRIFPSSSVAPQSLFEAARLENSNMGTRLRLLYHLNREYPYTSEAVRALLDIGDTHFLQGDLERALDALRAYQVRRGSGFNEPPLRLKIIYALLQLRRYEEGLSEIERLEMDHPAMTTAEKVLDVKSECQMALGRYAESILTLRTLLREYPNYALAPKALLGLALCYEEIRQPAAAEGVYARLVESYPPDRSDAPFETLAARTRLGSLQNSLFDLKGMEPEPPPPEIPAMEEVASETSEPLYQAPATWPRPGSDLPEVDLRQNHPNPSVSAPEPQVLESPGPEVIEE